MEYHSLTAEGTDFHTCYYYVDSDTEITIEENKQMRPFGEFVVEGEVVIDGWLIVQV